VASGRRSDEKTKDLWTKSVPPSFWRIIWLLPKGEARRVKEYKKPCGWHFSFEFLISIY
jgi:hypothetical protein